MDDIIKTALERFHLAETAESEFRQAAEEDLKFVYGEQWNDQAKNMREQAGLPCYTVNKVAEHLRHITNEMRQNKPSLQVDPTQGGATKETAELLAGLIRHIEYDSAADTAYDTASWYAVATGLGYIRLISEYEDFTSDNQKLVIKAIANPASVFFDPASKNPDGSDAEWCFIISDISHDEYKRKYGDSKLGEAITAGDFTDMKNSPSWMSESTVRVAEYYYKEWSTKTLYTVQIPDGSTYMSQEKPTEESLLSGEAIILKKRPLDIPTIKWCTINCKEIIGDDTIWPGDHIPVIPVKGNEFWINGKKETYGAVRPSKDAQKSYNWLVSIQTQMIASAPLAPFVGFKGQFKDVEHQWRDVNVAPIAYLEVDSKDSNGNQQALPQRMNSEPAIQAISATRMAAGDDIKAVFGVFDAALGNRSNETSGTAILARTAQANISNYHFYDNLIRSVTQLGKIMVQVIPTFYDTERVVRIVNENGTREMETINTTDSRTGKPKFDFSIGKYDVVIQTGPNYATRRQEAATEMSTLIGAYPNAGPLIADLAADAMDWPGSTLVAKRLRAAVPPEILAATGENDDNTMEPAAKAAMLATQLKQATDALKAINAHAQQVEQELKNEKMENTLLKQKSDVALAKAEMDKNLKNRELDLEEAQTELQFMVREEELKLSRRELALKEAQLAMSGVKAMNDMEHMALSAHERQEDRSSAAKDKEIDTEIVNFPSGDNELGNQLNNALE